MKKFTLFQYKNKQTWNFRVPRGLCAGMLICLTLSCVSGISIRNPYNKSPPSLSFPASQTANTYTYYIHATNTSVLSGAINAGELTDTYTKDCQYQSVQSASQTHGMRITEKIKVAYTFPISAGISFRFSAEVREYYQGHPTSVRYAYKITCLNASDHEIMETTVSATDQTQTFAVPQEIAQVEITCQKKYWYWESDYSLMLKVDLLEISGIKENQAPIVVTNPQISSAPVYLGSNISIWGESFTDPDGSYTPLSLATHWEVNHMGLITEIPYETTHNLTLDRVRFSVNDKVRGVVIATDSMGLTVSASSSWLTILNSLPVINSIALISNEVNASVSYRTSTLTCIASCADNDPLQNLTQIYEWRQNGVVKVYSLNNQFHLMIYNSSVNDLISCRVVPNDGLTNGSSQEVSMIVQNQPAWIDGPVVLSPNNPLITNDITVVHSAAYDPENDNFTILYNFYRVRGGITVCVQNSSSPVLNHSLALLQCNDSMYVMVRVNDSYTPFDLQYCQTTPMITVENANPIINALQITVFDAARVTLLTDPLTYKGDCQISAMVHLLDAEVQTLQAQFAWYLASDSHPLQVHLIAADGSGNAADWLNGSLMHLVHGEGVFVVITAMDGMACGDSNASSIILIQNTFPVIRSVHLAPVPVSKKANLRIDVVAEDFDNDTVYYEIIYYLNGARYLEGSSVLPRACFTHGDVIFATIRPYDLYLGMKNLGQMITTDTYVVENNLPSIQSVSIPESNFAGSEISAKIYVTDEENDGIYVSYVWIRNADPIIGCNSSILPGSYFVKGDHIWCNVTAIDSYNGYRTAPVGSNIAYIINSPPSMNNATIGVILADTTFNLPVIFSDDTLVLLLNSTDKDGDLLTLETHWFVNGEEIVTATNSSSLNKSNFQTRDQIQVKVRISDGETTTAWMGTSEIVISQGSRFALVDWGKIQAMSPRMAYFLIAVFAATLLIGFAQQRRRNRIKGGKFR